MKETDEKILLTPGPVAVPADILQELSRPMIHHRTPTFIKIFKDVLAELKNVFGTEQAVMIHTSTGSGAMESAVVNTLSYDDEVLCVVSGKFGERWSEICKTYKLKVHELATPWGSAVQLEQISTILQKHPKIKAVFCQYCETSTATVHPVREIAELVKKNAQTLFIVDAITAIAAMPLQMDEWGLDVVVAGSQKAFMMPTGLSFIALSEKAWSFQKKSNLPKYYFDLKNEKTANEKGQSFFSSSVSHIRALGSALQYFKGAKLQANIQRCSAIGSALRLAGAQIEMPAYSSSPSSSVTALLVPDGIDGEKLCNLLEDKFHVTVMGGQDQLKGKIVRLGHLGPVSLSHFEKAIEGLGKSLQLLGKDLHDEKIKKALEIFRHETKSLK